MATWTDVAGRTRASPISDEIGPAEYARALEGVHAEMRQFDIAAPHFTDRVEEAESIVEDRSVSRDLADDDRELLTNSLRGFRQAVVDRGGSEHLLHGEPHVGNLVKSSSGIRLEVDETTPVDPIQLRDCRILMLAMVASVTRSR